MQHLNDKATAIFRKLTEGLAEGWRPSAMEQRQFVYGGLRRNHRQDRPWPACVNRPLLRAERRYDAQTRTWCS